MALVYARPDADSADGNWTNESNLQTNLFASIDETVASDTDFIQSMPAPSGDIVKVSLSNPGPVTTPAKVRYRYKKRDVDLPSINLTVSLLEGTTEIVSWQHDDIGTSYVDAEQDITAVFGSISNVNNLFLQFNGGGWWLSGASIDLDFRNGRYYEGTSGQAVTSYLSISRASTGYATNSDGTMTSFASDTLRIGVGTGVLIEDARTNILLRSQEIDNATWLTAGSLTSITADQAVAPDGTTTMDKITEDTTDNRHGRYLDLGGFERSTVRSASIFLKNGDRRYAYFGFECNTAVYWGIFDLQTGTVTDSGSTSSVTFDGAFIEAFSNGVYRCSLRNCSGAAGPGATYFNAFLCDRSTLAGGGTTFGQPSYIATSKFLYAWGAQLEDGAFPSSYIPTTTVSVTRAADAVTNIGNLSSNIAAATGSIVVQTSYAEGTSFAANIVDSNGTNLLGFDATNHGLASISATLATSNTANRSATADKTGLAWSGAGRSLVLNNSTVATDATAQTPNATQHLGSSGSGNFFYGYIQRLTVWTSKLADATLQGFTA